MSYVIFLESYSQLFNSQDENTIKEALQQLFELHVQGKTIIRSKRSQFTAILEKLITFPSKKVRKWAYHCACYYPSGRINSAIKSQLITENDVENILWALTALSVTYDQVEELRKCVGKRHEEFVETISPYYLQDAMMLYGGVIDINPITILKTGNSADLAALTKVYAYKPIVENKYPDVTLDIIKEMEQHANPYVREYAYWAQVLAKEREEYLSNDSLPKMTDSNPSVANWQIALYIIAGDVDFIVSTLKPMAACPQNIDFEIKKGVMRGLEAKAYHPKYVPYIYGWFAKESKLSIIFKLIDYMILHCYRNRDDGTYFFALKDALEDEAFSEYIVSLIKSDPNYKLTISTKNGHNYLDINKEV